MKKLSLSIAITGILFTSLLVTGCGSKQNEVQQQQTEESAHQHGAQMDSSKMDSTNNNTMTATIYACPMHPEVTGKEGDKCPKCGMALEAVKVTKDN